MAKKYIDAERLRKEVKRLEKAVRKAAALGCADSETRKFHEGKDAAYQLVDILIFSLQQEQPEFPTTDEEIEIFLATHPKVEVPNKYKTPDWLWKKQEQPEVELEEEMEKVGANWPFPASFDGYAKEWVDGLMEECAKHFYELGLKAKEENK